MSMRRRKREHFRRLKIVAGEGEFQWGKFWIVIPGIYTVFFSEQYLKGKK